MVGETIGEVDFLVDFDGRALPAKAKKLGEEAGTRAASGFKKGMDEDLSNLAAELEEDMTRAGDLSGVNFTDAMEKRIKSRKFSLANELADVFGSSDGLDRFVGKTGSLEEATDKLRAKMADLNNVGGLSDKMYNRLGGTLNNYIGRTRKAAAESGGLENHLKKLDIELRSKVKDTDNAGGGFDRLTQRMKKNREETDRNSGSHVKLSHNMRQVLAIALAIAAGAQDIAVLGSAAGAGLVIFAAAAGALLLTALPLIIGFAGVNGELSKIPAGARKAVGVLQDIGNEFKALQDKVQVALLEGLEGPLRAAADNLIPAIQDGLVKVAGVLNTSIGDLLGRLASPEAQKRIQQIFDIVAQAAPVFVSIFGNIGSALAGIFIAAGPYVQRFLAFLDRITTQFDDFVNSIGGQDELSQWFANGTRVLGAFVKLLGSAGKVLSGVVTPEAIDHVIEFLDNLSGAMPFIQDLIDAFGELDAFGIVAAILNDVGNALSPILDLLKPILGIIRDSLMTSLQGLAFVLDLILLPLKLLQPLFDFFGYLMGKAAEYSSKLLETLQPILDTFEDLADQIGAALQPALEDLADSLLGLLPSPEALEKIIREQVIPAMKDIADFVINTLVPNLITFIDGITDTIDSLGGFPGIVARVQVFVRGFQIAMNLVRLALLPVKLAVDALIAALIFLGALKVKVPTIHATGNNYTVGGIPVTASGTIVRTPQLRIFGEAGPEAVVPLDRPLNQVDPDVRALSAFAQGKLNFGGGRVVTVEAGAIVVTGVRDERQAARIVLDELVDNL